MKYIGKNKKDNDCAIVGIFNASVWLKKEMSYEDIEWLAKEYYEYDPKVGLDSFFINDFMKFIDMPVQSLENYNIQSVEKEILNGNGALAAVFDDDYECGHLVFLKPNGKEIEVLNYNKKWIDIVLGFTKRDMKLNVWKVKVA